MAVARPLYAVGFKDTPGVTAQERLRAEVTTSLALAAALGRSSALYQELYEADLIDDGFTSRFQLGGSFGHTYVAGETGIRRSCIDG